MSTHPGPYVVTYSSGLIVGAQAATNVFVGSCLLHGFSLMHHTAAGDALLTITDLGGDALNSGESAADDNEIMGGVVDENQTASSFFLRRGIFVPDGLRYVVEDRAAVPANPQWRVCIYYTPLKRTALAS